MTKTLKVLSLFSGIGAFEKALTNLQIPYELIGFSEIDKYAIESYKAIHNADASLSLGSVTDIDATHLGEIDLLTHGSPCQSFSNANMHSVVKGGDEGSGTSSSLMWETVRIIKENKPKVVIWENVKAVLNKKNVANFDRYISELSELGYISSHSAMNSRDYEVAQNRPRVFVVSILDSDTEFQFPKPIPLNKSIGDYLDSVVDEKYIVPERILNTFYNKDNNFSQSIEIRPIDTYAYCLVAKSGRAARTNNYVYNDLNFYETSQYNKYDIGEMIKDNVKIRALSPLEYWRLQGFSDEDFYKAQSHLNSYFHKGIDKADAQLYKQAGNSITVNVVEKILEKLYK